MWICKREKKKCRIDIDRRIYKCTKVIENNTQQLKFIKESIQFTLVYWVSDILRTNDRGINIFLSFLDKLLDAQNENRDQE